MNDESALVARARDQGDTAAFGQLVQLHQSRIRGLLRRLARGDAALADELAQDAFLQAWRQLGSYQGHARFSTWLYSLTVNVWRQHARAHQLEWQRTDHEFAARANADDADEPPPSPEGQHTPEPALHLQADVNKALALLPEGQRQALLLCYFDDLSHPEAAAALGVPLGTLKTRVNRGKVALRTHLLAWSSSADAPHRDKVTP